MARALALAARGLYTTTPNPRVGCVIVHDGAVIGEGFHERAGAPHAEVNALADARGRGCDPRGATLYATLEPCNHFGRTPPCVDAILAAGVGRVVAAMPDPNPAAAHGSSRLRAAGVAVDVGLLESEARELNVGFVSRMARGIPWVRVKIAASVDGRTALANGASQWITGAEARADGHAWRARACAVLTDPQRRSAAHRTRRRNDAAAVARHRRSQRGDAPSSARVRRRSGSRRYCRCAKRRVAAECRGPRAA